MAADWTRALATLLLLGLSLAAWKLLLQPTQQPPKASGSVATSGAQHSRAPSAKTGKKKQKKRAAKKPATTATASSAPVVAVPAAASAAVADAPASASDDDSDEDDGLSAAQILARRKFTTTRALGSSRAASRPMQLKQQQQASHAPKYELNQRVLARFQGGAEWFPATITEVRRGNEYNVAYDDGEREFHVPYKLIKPRDSADATTDKAPATAATAMAEPAQQRLPTSSSSGSDDSRRGRAPSSSDVDDDGSDDDDGWSIVGASSTKPKSRGSALNTAPPQPASDGLTKRQRENRRKKERQREIKELARAQAQENGLHAKWGGTYSKMKYVPPPPTQP